MHDAGGGQPSSSPGEQAAAATLETDPVVRASPAAAMQKSLRAGQNGSGRGPRCELLAQPPGVNSGHRDNR